MTAEAQPATHLQRDTGVLAALLQLLETERLPTMLRLEKQVDAGARLTQTEIDYLKRVFAQAQAAGLQPLIARHPEYRDLLSSIFSFYSTSAIARSKTK